VPPGAAQVPGRRRSDHRCRLRHRRSRVRGLDRPDAAAPDRYRAGRRGLIGQPRSRSDRRSRLRVVAARRPAGRRQLLDCRNAVRASAELSGAVASADELFCGARRNRRRAPRVAAQRNSVLRCRRAYAPDRQSVDGACARDIPHHQRLVIHGFWVAGSDCGQACAPRLAGGLPAGRRLLPDDLWRGGNRQAPGYRPSDRRAR
jgi:hypothetical protein